MSDKKKKDTMDLPNEDYTAVILGDITGTHIKKEVVNGKVRYVVYGCYESCFSGHENYDEARISFEELIGSYESVNLSDSIEDAEDTYVVQAHCTNCNNNFDAKVPKGTEVPKKIKCENCGCMTAERDCEPFEPYRAPEATPLTHTNDEGYWFRGECVYGPQLPWPTYKGTSGMYKDFVFFGKTHKGEE